MAHRTLGPVDPNDHAPLDEDVVPRDDSKIIVARKFRGKGRLLREDLRQLPEDSVTDDIEDADRVHALDPDHVRDAVAIDKQRADQAEKVPDEEKPQGVPEWKPVRQDFVDMIILSVTKTLLDRAVLNLKRGQEHGLQHYHLWFPENDIRIYGLRPGNPPPNIERPEHLKNIDLVVDPTELNPRIIALITESPTRMQQFAEGVRESGAEQIRVALAQQGILT